jgi:hypothetical protein
MTDSADTVSSLYLFAKDKVIHGAPAQFCTTSPCGIATGDMTHLFTPAQAAYSHATPANTADYANSTVCRVCFPG